MFSKTVDKTTHESEKLNTEKEKRRIARLKERRATLILGKNWIHTWYILLKVFNFYPKNLFSGMIMGSFIACWLPFFLLYVISPVCPICPVSALHNVKQDLTSVSFFKPEPTSDAGLCVPVTLFSTAFWLGYSNSAFNPVFFTFQKKILAIAIKKFGF